MGLLIDLHRRLLSVDRGMCMFESGGHRGRAYDGGLGAVPPSGSRDRARDNLQ